MIYKIEIYPHYTYPIIEKKTSVCEESKETTFEDVMTPATTDNCCAHSPNDTDLCLSPPSSPPYRTLSHYGFNYPITYRPSLTLQPVCLLTPIELQRQKVIAFIKRLNLIDNRTTTTRVSSHHEKTGKEDICKVKKNKSFDLESLRKTNSSFVSIKEVQLLHKSSAEENENLIKESSSYFQESKELSELNSEHCSSLLSISATYPTVSQTHSLMEMMDQDETENLNSTENYSNDNLSKTYLIQNSKNITSRKPLRNFKGRKEEETETQILGEDDHGPGHDHDHDHDPHKPEAEQQIKNSRCHYNEDKINDELADKHITLTLNTLKRRAIALNNKNKLCLDRNNKTQTNVETYTSCVSSNDSSTTSSAAIEIHINVTVRNSDCVESLRTHEREFKAKLEKVIDDEINLIVQELGENQDNYLDKEEDDKSHLYENTLNFSSRRLSAPESTNNNIFDRKAMAHNHNCRNSTVSSTLPASDTKFESQTNAFSLYSLRNRHILSLLEHELETLLNNIIGENVQNGDHSEAHLSTFSHSSKEDISTDGSPKKDKKKKKGLRTPSFLKKKKEKKKPEA
uniref:Uncharacterized protein n=1 Tax=Glossina brevipalpis TaxID=37001 RepID=A0A1A9WWU1_9MUSC